MMTKGEQKCQNIHENNVVGYTGFLLCILFLHVFPTHAMYKTIFLQQRYMFPLRADFIDSLN